MNPMSDATLPTKAEIAQLPRWARVAFAARCARKALPQFQSHWPQATPDQIRRVARAIEFSERAAAEANLNRKAYAAANSSAVATARDADIADAAIAAAAARAAVDATEAAVASDASYPASAAARAASNAAVPKADVRSDFQRLVRLAQQSGWTDATPVPPSVFDPVDSLPTPVVATTEDLDCDDHVAMVLRAFGEPGVSAATLAEHLLATYNALNKYTLAKYGKHLSRGRFRRLLLSHAGVPA